MPQKYECYNTRPCYICGKKDWCYWLDYGHTGILHYCHRVHDEEILANGRTYIAKKEVSGCTVYEDTEQYERNLEEWIASKEGENGFKKRKILPKKRTLTLPAKQEEKKRVYEKYPVASSKRLDEVYRYFLSLLVLENWHEKLLRDEWNSPVFKNLYEFLIGLWTIKTLPPNDYVRFASKIPYKNLSRKSIMERMIRKFGTLEGVPGFYQKEDSTWSCYYLAGMVFPCYNTNGQIIRLRIRDDFPVIKKAVYKGNQGEYRYECTEKEVGWFFCMESEEEKILVSGFNRITGKAVRDVSLNKNGQPPGEVDGKYKNFTSYKEKDIEEDNLIRVINYYNKGTKSGSPISLYMKKGDDIRTVYITEGEKKAMVINAFTGCPVISLPGVATYNKLFEPQEEIGLSIMDVLKAAGVINVVLMYDADKRSNENVSFNEKQAMAQILVHGFVLWVGEWLQYFGKGSDDCYITGVKPVLHRITTTNL